MSDAIVVALFLLSQAVIILDNVLISGTGGYL